MATSSGSVLAALRTAIGSAAWIAPNKTAKLFGLDPEGNPQSTFFARLFGVRDVALAAAAVGAVGPSRRLVWQAGVACDVLDVGAVILARRNGTLPARAALMAGTTALLAVGLGLGAVRGEGAPNAG